MKHYKVKQAANGWIVSEYSPIRHGDMDIEYVFPSLDAMNAWLKDRHPEKAEESASRMFERCYSAGIDQQTALSNI